MSTTAKYNFMFIIPIGLSDFPIPFDSFSKGVDENGDSLGFYSYNEYMAIEGNKAFYVPTGTIVDETITPDPVITYDEEGNEVATQPADYTQSKFVPSHVLLSMNITSIFDLATRFPYYINMISPDTVIKEGVDVEAWTDADQSNYLWIISTEPRLGYNYNEFIKVSLLFNKPIEEEVV